MKFILRILGLHCFRVIKPYNHMNSTKVNFFFFFFITFLHLCLTGFHVGWSVSLRNDIHPILRTHLTPPLKEKNSKTIFFFSNWCKAIGLAKKGLNNYTKYSTKNNIKLLNFFISSGLVLFFVLCFVRVSLILFVWREMDVSFCVL